MAWQDLFSNNIVRQQEVFWGNHAMRFSPTGLGPYFQEPHMILTVRSRESSWRCSSLSLRTHGTSRRNFYLKGAAWHVTRTGFSGTVTKHPRCLRLKRFPRHGTFGAKMEISSPLCWEHQTKWFLEQLRKERNWWAGKQETEVETLVRMKYFYPKAWKYKWFYF